MSKDRLLLLYLFTPILIIFNGCSTAQFVDQLVGSCDQLSAGYLLRCIGPLLQFTRYNIHPKISSGNYSSSATSKFGDQICLLYNDYKFCAPVQLRQRCADLVSSVESVYDYVCSPDIFSNFSKNADCLVKVDSTDAQVALCEQNTTTTLRRVASVASLSMAERMHMQCDAVQQYFFCIMNKFIDACGEDSWELKVAITKRSTAVELANCTFETKPRPEDLAKPICLPNATCICRPGFTLSNDICTDVDECMEKIDMCSQHCENRPGSFVCLCDDRYYNLSNDGRKCVRKDKDTPYIFFAHGQSIWNITLDGKNFQLKRASLQKTAMIDIDAKERMLYYIDIAANKLERIRFEGAFPQTLQAYDLEGTEGLAVDWIGRCTVVPLRKLYSAKGPNVYVQELDGRFRKTLYSNVFKLPRALAAHSLKGYLFATDWGAQAFVAKMKMDGSDFKQIITTGLTWPNGLTIDIYAGKLYWADAFADIIECSDLDGSHRRTVVQDANTVPHPFGMAIIDDDLYWTDWTYRGILKASKFNGENVTVVAQTALLPYGMKIYYPGVQPEGRNPCGSNNGNCDHMCLLSPANDNSTSGPLDFTCVCAEGYQLGPNGKSCKPHCNQNQIVCSGNDAKCISKKYWCDGIAQCNDKSDEENCPPRICLSNQFQCHNNKSCIIETKLCDNTKNCNDGSDEIYC